MLFFPKKLEQLFRVSSTELNWLSSTHCSQDDDVIDCRYCSIARGRNEWRLKMKNSRDWHCGVISCPKTKLKLSVFRSLCFLDGFKKISSVAEKDIALLCRTTRGVNGSCWMPCWSHFKRNQRFLRFSKASVVWQASPSEKRESFSFNASKTNTESAPASVNLIGRKQVSEGNLENWVYFRTSDGFHVSPFIQTVTITLRQATPSPAPPIHTRTYTHTWIPQKGTTAEKPENGFTSKLQVALTSVQFIKTVTILLHASLHFHGNLPPPSPHPHFPYTRIPRKGTAAAKLKSQTRIWLCMLRLLP